MLPASGVVGTNIHAARRSVRNFEGIGNLKKMELQIIKNSINVIREFVLVTI